MRPVNIALRLIELLGLHQPAGVTELSQLAKLPKSTIQRNLLALQRAGWIEMCDRARGQWTLTMRAAIAAGGRSTPNQLNLRNIAIPVMESIRQVTKETVYLSYMFEHAMVVYERLDGIKPVTHFIQTGTVYGLHASSSGKAILAKMSSVKFRQYLAHQGNFRSCPVDEALVPPNYNLRREIQKIREDGYAIAKYLEIWSVAAAICDRDNQPFASISLSTPAERCTSALLKRWGPLMADGARRISIGAIAVPGSLAL